MVGGGRRCRGGICGICGISGFHDPCIRDPCIGDPWVGASCIRDPCVRDPTAARYIVGASAAVGFSAVLSCFAAGGSVVEFSGRFSFSAAVAALVV